MLFISRCIRKIWSYLTLLILAGLTLLAVLILAATPTKADSVSDTIPAGTHPNAVAVNPITNKIYIANFSSNDVTVIDGTDNSTTTIPVGTNPFAVAVNSATNKIYVANIGSNNVTVIDGTDNSTTTVTVGMQSSGIALNPIANKIYVANFDNNNVTVINGSDNSTSTVTVGASPRAVAVNPVTNKIYVANTGGNLTVINGINNSATTVTVGSLPEGVAVNPITNKIYVANRLSNDVTIITPAKVHTSPLTVDITRLPGNTTNSATPSFTLAASSAFSPTAPPVQQIYFQVDTWTGRWLKANPSGPIATGTTPTLQPGVHIIYAWAADGQEATSINTGQGSSPVPGQISAYLFLVSPLAPDLDETVYLPVVLKN